MRNQCLTGASLTSPEDVVGHLGAVQSQDYGPAKWSLAQRTRGSSDAEIDRRFGAGSILRTHVLRPTWHFVLSEDIRWMLELTAPRVHRLTTYRHRQLDLDSQIFKRCNALLERALKGGNQLIRKEVGHIFNKDGIVADGQRLGHILMNAELEGVVCSGALRGKQHTYALLEERAPHAKHLPRDRALSELVRRYFTGHGPATRKDLMWWSSLTMTDIDRGLEIAQEHLDHETIAGVTYWLSAGDSARGRKPKSPVVHLVQGYDEYIIGYGESRGVLDIAGVTTSGSPRAPIGHGFVLRAGQAAGLWKRSLTKGSVLVEVALYARLDAHHRRALQQAADALGDFLGLTPEVVTTRL